MTEMKTPPLMGLLTREFLGVSHTGGIQIQDMDGIINLHNAPGSEAQVAAANYAVLSQAEKDALRTFLMSLGRPEFDFNPTSTVFFSDLKIDLNDFNKFHACFNGPQNYSPNVECAIGDINQDRKVDLIDANKLLEVYHPPLDDCQCNATLDFFEILQGTPDTNMDAIVDACRVNLSLFIIDKTVIDSTHVRLTTRTWTQPGDAIEFFYNFDLDQGTGIPYGGAYCINLNNQTSLGTAIANSSGKAEITNIVLMPEAAKKVFTQAGAFRSGTDAVKSVVVSADITPASSAASSSPATSQTPPTTNKLE